MAQLDNILDKKRYSLQCVRRTEADGRRFYVYVLIHRTRKDEFEAMVEAGETDFSGIGTVITTGEGEPPEEMLDHILDHILKPEARHG